MTLFKLKDDYYQAIINDILFLVHPDNLHESVILYAEKIASLYPERKDSILEYVIAETDDFYSKRYSKDEIKSQLQKPYIEIINKDFGAIVWNNHMMDEHIIECEFGKDLELCYVTVDG